MHTYKRNARVRLCPGVTCVTPDKWLIHNRLHELYETKLPFVLRIEFVRSKLPIFPHVCLFGR